MQMLFTGVEVENEKDGEKAKPIKFVGWSDQTEMSSQDYLNSLASLKSVERVESYFSIGPLLQNKTNVNFSRSRINFLAGACFTSAITDSVINYYIEEFQKLKLIIEIPENIKISIRMIDQNQFNGIMYKDDSFEGDKIFKKTDYNVYDIELSGNELDQRDTEADCMDYDTETYKDCFDRATKDDFGFLGCTLPWLTDNENEICRHNAPNIDAKVKAHFQEYMTYIDTYFNDKYFQPVACKKPCKTVKIKSSSGQVSVNMGFNFTRYIFNFNPKVKVIKSILKTSLLDVGNTLGSSIGLWLGFSTFSIFQAFKEVGVKFFRKHCEDQNIYVHKIGFVLISIIFGLSQFLFMAFLFLYYNF